MATSGATNFNPSNGELILYAYGLCGVRPPEMTQQHMFDARMAVNLWQSEKSNIQPNLWKVTLLSIPLIQSVSTYSLPTPTIAILDGVIETNTGVVGSQNDIYMLPISRTQYASYPDKLTTGRPTVYWFDRLISPTVTVWQPPDGNGPYLFNVYIVSQQQDAVLPSGGTLDLPYRFFAAFAFGLAEYLAWSYAPDRVDKLAAKAALLWDKAAEQDVEDAGIFIAPMMGGYYRR